MCLALTSDRYCNTAAFYHSIDHWVHSNTRIIPNTFNWKFVTWRVLDVRCWTGKVPFLYPVSSLESLNHFISQRGKHEGDTHCRWMFEFSIAETVFSSIENLPFISKRKRNIRSFKKIISNKIFFKLLQWKKICNNKLKLKRLKECQKL